MSQFFYVHPDNPQGRLMKQAAAIISQGGVIVYPTDSGYALGCHIGDKKALERVCNIRSIDKEHNFTLMCSDLSELSEYTRVDNSAFRLLKNNTPGPYTFIFKGSKEVPKRLLNPKRKTIGIRVPDNKICQLLLEEFGQPIISTSLPEEEDLEEMTEPEVIYYKFENQIDAMLSTGPGGIENSTVVACTEGDFEILREGKGELLIY